MLNKNFTKNDLVGLVKEFYRDECLDCDSVFIQELDGYCGFIFDGTKTLKSDGSVYHETRGVATVEGRNFFYRWEGIFFTPADLNDENADINYETATSIVLKTTESGYDGDIVSVSIDGVEVFDYV